MDEKPKKKTLKEKFNRAAGKVKKFLSKARHIPAIFADTARDLRRQPREMGLLAAGVVIPGGFIAYGIYRAEIYRRKRAANDNAQKPDVKKKTPKPPKPL